MNLNKAIIVGRLTRDPESRALPSGQAVSNFGMATNRTWTNPETNEKQEQTEFHNIVAFGRLAEICNQYLTKGSLAMIEGRIQTRSWQDQNGDTKYRTEIVAERMQMGPKNQGTGKIPSEEPINEGLEEIQIDEKKEEKNKKKDNLEENKEEVKDEDIPF